MKMSSEILTVIMARKKFKTFWDVFISYASEDRNNIAEPLAKNLRQKGLKVWFDKFELKLGDSIRRSIDLGISQSRFGIVILSKSFFGKKWTETELNGLNQLEVNGRKVILPVWCNISAGLVRKFSPTLADRNAVEWSSGLENVSKEICKSVILAGEKAANESQHFLNLLSSMPAWDDSKTVRIGMTCEYLELRSGKIVFTDRFVKFLGEESQNAVARLDSSILSSNTKTLKKKDSISQLWDKILVDENAINEIWPALKTIAILKSKDIKARMTVEDLDYFSDHINDQLTQYLGDICNKLKLLTIDDSGAWDIEQNLIEELYGLLYQVENKEGVRSFIIRSLARLVEARLAIETPQYFEYRYLIALFLFLVMEVGPYVQAIEFAIEYNLKDRRMSFDKFLDKKIGKKKHRNDDISE